MGSRVGATLHVLTVLHWPSEVGISKHLLPRSADVKRRVYWAEGEQLITEYRNSLVGVLGAL